MYDFERNALQKILERLNAMEPLSPIGSPAYREDAEAWRKQRETMREELQQAMRIALMALPPEVGAVYQQVNARYEALKAEVLKENVIVTPVQDSSKEDTNA